MNRSVWTEVKVQPRQFKLYQVRQQIELTFSMREFKAAIALADHLKLPLELSFNQGGLPLIIKVECPAVVAEIYIATSSPNEEESQPRGGRDAPSAPKTYRQVEEGQESRLTAQGQEESATLLDEELQREIYRQDSEVVYSGRSAGEYINGPLQSTAPVEYPANGRQGTKTDHEPTSAFSPARRQSKSPTVEREDPLFLGNSSSQERSNDSAMDTRMERALEEAVEAAEAEEEQRQQSQAKPTRAADEALSDIMNNSTDANYKSQRKGSETIREKPAYSVSDDEEEIPSTQRESTTKRTKVSRIKKTSVREHLYSS